MESDWPTKQNYNLFCFIFKYFHIFMYDRVSLLLHCVIRSAGSHHCVIACVRPVQNDSFDIVHGWMKLKYETLFVIPKKSVGGLSEAISRLPEKVNLDS